MEPGRQAKRRLSPIPKSRARKVPESQYSQSVSIVGSVAIATNDDSSSSAAVSSSSSSSSSSGAAVGASAVETLTPAMSRQKSMSENLTSVYGSGSVPFTPQFVVDWLYQALLDTVRVLEGILGTVCYDARGMPAVGGGWGQVVLFWGTHLGSLREQALIAWDYDVDLAVFYHGKDFEYAWKLCKAQLGHMNYVCTQHSAHKFRVAPPNPATWSPWRELYQETRENNPRLNRAELNKTTGSRWRQGVRAKQPHGSNCVDIEIYRVQPDTPLKLFGSKPIPSLPSNIFPTAVGVFGPLQFAIPRTPSMLLAEYGKDCLQRRKVKLKTKAGHTAVWGTVVENTRHAAWPAIPLRHAKEYLS